MSVGAGFGIVGHLNSCHRMVRFVLHCLNVLNAQILLRIRLKTERQNDALIFHEMEVLKTPK